ncbi:MAG TPA: DUF1634 domain-containing protein [Terriglobales bacterium]|nr:DUF1634 domain-containing protein [Terriglobales bacterium]
MDDKKTQAIIGSLLRTGVFLSAAIVLIGACLLLARTDHSGHSYNIFRGEPAQLRTLAGIAQGARSGEPGAVIQLGLLLLIATPIARVLFSAIAFAFEHDWMYVLITLIVLSVLLYSLFSK